MTTCSAAIALFLALGAAVPQTAAAAPAAPAAQAAHDALDSTLAEFMDALNHLDQARFDALFAEDATAFFPSPPFPIRRVEGKAEITAWFGRLFNTLRPRRTGPGSTAAADVSRQIVGDTAVISFHLNGRGDVGRRTLVLRRDAPGWRIVHLHASSLDEPSETQGES